MRRKQASASEPFNRGEIWDMSFDISHLTFFGDSIGPEVCREKSFAISETVRQLNGCSPYASLLAITLGAVHEVSTTAR